MTYISKKQNPLRIRVGDVVTIKFDHMPNDPAFDADVLEIVDRTTWGQDAGITYRRHDGQTNEPITPDGCSVSHVIKVVHGPYESGPRTTTNIFRENLTRRRQELRDRPHGWIGWYAFGGVRVGTRDNLVMAALAQASDELARPYNPEKLKTLWNRAGCPGKVASPNEDEYPSRRYLCVRWKVFKRWVLKNRHRLLMTRKEMEQEGRDYLQAMDESYSADLDREAEEERYEPAYDQQEYEDSYAYEY